MHQKLPKGSMGQYKEALVQLAFATILPALAVFATVIILIDKQAIVVTKLSNIHLLAPAVLMLCGLVLTNRLLINHIKSILLMRKQLIIERRISNGLRKHQFIPVYQAKVDMQGRIVGCEALSRWKTEAKLVPPASYIAHAIQSEQIKQIDISVAIDSMRQVVRWKKAGVIDVFTLSFNLSPLTLSEQSIVVELASEIKKTSYYGVIVEVEITEQSLLTFDETTNENMRILRSAGARFALDDFSAGHSSMNSILSLQFDTLKFDRSLVSPIRLNESKANASFALIRAMSSVAKSLSINTVLEGIETSEDLEYYRHTGVELVQGFLFSMPVSDIEFIDLLKQRS